MSLTPPPGSATAPDRHPPSVSDRDWLDVCAADDLVPGSLVRVPLPGGSAAVVARVQDEFFAVGAECTHRQLPLDDGRIVGEDLVCPWHRGRFSLRTGKARALPAGAPLPVYRVRLEAGRVQINAEERS